ncbi:hypothetical protein BDW69DRAFT_170802 [Aspergillus filifer]
MMDYRTAGLTQEQLPASCQQPRPAALEILRIYGRTARGRLSKLFSWNFNQLIPDKAPRQAPVVRSTSRRLNPVPADPPGTTTRLSIPSIGQRPSSASGLQALFIPPEHRVSGSAADTPVGGVYSEHPSWSDQRTRCHSFDTLVANSDLEDSGQQVLLNKRPSFGIGISAGFSILLKFRGDGPKQTQQATASFETRSLKINLMHSKIWNGLSENGRRGSLEPAGNIYMNPTGSESIPVRGVARNVEWYFKNGPRTYISDFYVMEDDRFDVLIGCVTAWQYRLLEVAVHV